MTEADVWREALTYAVVWTVATAVGIVLIGAGAYRWVLPGVASYADGTAAPVVLRAAAPGIALVLLGLLLWKVLTALALYRTLSAAFAAETAARLNTESMKSDILSVIDERLADINQDTRRTRQVVERAGRDDAADAFEFPEEG